MQKALILSGYPGSGKGTQGRLMAGDLDWRFKESGFILRSLSSQDNFIGKLAQKAIKNYNELLWWEKKILNKEIVGGVGRNVIIDGFARHKESIDYVDKNFIDFRILHIKISSEQAIERISGRLYNEVTGETFNKNLDEINEIYSRKPGDESMKIIRRRLKAFDQRGIPLLIKEKNNGRVFEIDGDGTIEEVRIRIQKLIGEEKKFFN